MKDGANECFGILGREDDEKQTHLKALSENPRFSLISRMDIFLSVKILCVSVHLWLKTCFSVELRCVYYGWGSRDEHLFLNSLLYV